MLVAFGLFGLGLVGFGWVQLILPCDGRFCWFGLVWLVLVGLGRFWLAFGWCLSVSVGVGWLSLVFVDLCWVWSALVGFAWSGLVLIGVGWLGWFWLVWLVWVGVWG